MPNFATTGTSPTRFDRMLRWLLPTRAAESRDVARLSLHAFTILFTYYLLRPVREVMILADGSAELRSLATGLVALGLMVLVPIYGAWCRRFDRMTLVRGITVGFMATLLGFAGLAATATPIGIPFFIWLGAFSVLSVAQFWAFAADIVDARAGKRLFPLIATGATLGAWVGSRASTWVLGQVGSVGVMLIAVAGMGLTVVLAQRSERAARCGSGTMLSTRPSGGRVQSGGCGGFTLILRDRYLTLIALSVVLLNWITATGDYVLASAVIEYADSALSSSLSREEIIGSVYGRLYSWTSLLAFAIQLLLVSRLLRAIGVGAAAVLLPVFILAGYAVLGFVPIFALLQMFKALEGAGDYSLHNTARHALFLKTSRAGRYEGQTAVETFFWRLGDLIQAGVICVATRWFDAGASEFMLLNLVLAGILVAVCVAIGRRYARMGDTAPQCSADDSISPCTSPTV